MIGTWLARIRRVDEVSDEVSALRERVTELETQVRIETERERATTLIAAIANQMTAIHGKTLESHRIAIADAGTLAALDDRVTDVEMRMAQHQAGFDGAAAASTKELALVLGQVLTLERQFRLQERHYAETSKALGERIDFVRRGEATTD